MVHGDLSLGNVLMGWDRSTGRIAVLCDYDGFYHPTQELLPIKYQGRDIRRLGSAGFQYPELRERLAAGDPDVCVATDRFALGALVYQIMIWKPEMSDTLKRHELLSTSIIESRDLSGLPPVIRSSWPEGFELLRRALAPITSKRCQVPEHGLPHSADRSYRHSD